MRFNYKVIIANSFSHSETNKEQAFCFNIDVKREGAVENRLKA